MDSILASHLAAPGSILGIPKDLAALHCLVLSDSGQWTVQTLNNVDRTHEVLQDSSSKNLLIIMGENTFNFKRFVKLVPN